MDYTGLDRSKIYAYLYYVGFLRPKSVQKRLNMKTSLESSTIFLSNGIKIAFLVQKKSKVKVTLCQ